MKPAYEETIKNLKGALKLVQKRFTELKKQLKDRNQRLNK